jgi:hypothetical protein
MIRRLKMKQIMNKKAPVQGPAKTNPVAKHAGKFNRSTVFQNRKKAAKNGRTRFKVNFTDLGNSGKAGKMGCKREDSKVIFQKTVLLSSRLPTLRVTG